MERGAVMVAFLCNLLLVDLPCFGAAEPVFPGLDWEHETNGLSPETLRAVEAFVHTLDTTGLMVVEHGRVIYEYGDVKAGRYLRLLDLLTGKQPASKGELASWALSPSQAHASPKGAQSH